MFGNKSVRRRVGKLRRDLVTVRKRMLELSCLLLKLAARAELTPCSPLSFPAVDGPQAVTCSRGSSSGTFFLALLQSPPRAWSTDYCEESPLYAPLFCTDGWLESKQIHQGSAVAPQAPLCVTHVLCHKWNEGSQPKVLLVLPAHDLLQDPCCLFCRDRFWLLACTSQLWLQYCQRSLLLAALLWHFPM